MVDRTTTTTSPTLTSTTLRRENCSSKSTQLQCTGSNEPSWASVKATLTAMVTQSSEPCCQRTERAAIPGGAAIGTGSASHIKDVIAEVSLDPNGSLDTTRYG